MEHNKLQGYSGRWVEAVFPRFFQIFLPLLIVIVTASLYVFTSEVDHQVALLEVKGQATVRAGVDLISEHISPILEDLNFLRRLTRFEIEASASASLDTIDIDRFTKELLFFGRTHPSYDQIRVLDLQGMERVRINNPLSGTVAVARDQLQDKSGRYYFQETLALRNNTIFISPMDLNVENGRIEQPLKPMIRFGQVVGDDKAGKYAVVIINFKAQLLLDKLRRWAAHQQGNLMLLNRDGYWLFSSRPEQEWAFMYPEKADISFASRYPELWHDYVAKTVSGQFSGKNGITTYTTVRPLRARLLPWEVSVGSSVAGAGEGNDALQENDKNDVRSAADEYYWKLVSFIPGSQVADIYRRQGKLVLLPAILFTLVSGGFSLLLAMAKTRQLIAQQELRLANEELETRVFERTRELENEIASRQQMEQALAQSEERYRSILDCMGEGVFTIDNEGQLTFCNPSFARTMGFSETTLLGCPYTRFLAPGQQPFPELVADAGFFHELDWICDDGSVAHTLISLSLLMDETGLETGYLALVNDVTVMREKEQEMEKMEYRLLQAQKMEAIGTLAGGIAHDFNNLLSIILGFSEMAETASHNNAELGSYLEKIISAGNRAKDLVQQILAFSRRDEKQLLHFKPGNIVIEALKMLRPAIPSTIRIIQDINTRTGTVFCDPTRFNQILMNLCTNAYHAMELEGGTMTVVMEEIELTAQDLIYEPNVAPGTFMHLSVGDTGEGILPQVQEKMYEPFFTTKEVGKGTGMGLAIVHGVVKGCNGFMTCYSELGKGTVFHVYLPVVNVEDAENESPKKRPSLPASPTGSEHILYVDDEEILATLGQILLESLGYRVTLAFSGEEALTLFQQSPDEYDAMITDQTMPNLTGFKLSQKILAMRPDFPIILCTGFSALVSREEALAVGIKDFHLKPLTKDILSRALRKILDG